MADKYNVEVDLNADTSHTRAIRLVGRNKKVLEVGCATGYVSAILTQQFDCVVTGIEQDLEAAQSAGRVCHRVLCGDAETLDYDKELQDATFQVILLTDVLEHLKDPRAVLRRLRDFLTTDGYVVASIPNVAHAAVALELLKGNFDYRPYGLLDDTHLRFFNARAIYELFESAGYVIGELDRLKVEPSATELGIDHAAFPREVVKFAMLQDESTTYQFIIKAYPSTEAGTILALRQGLRDAEQHAQRAAAREIAQEAQVAAAQRESEAGGQRITELEALLADLQARIKTFERSRSWRLTAPLRAMRRVVRLRGLRLRS